MSPEFLALSGNTVVSDALEEIRRSPVAPGALGVIYTTDEDGRLTGTASVVWLVKSPPAARIGEVAASDPVVKTYNDSPFAVDLSQTVNNPSNFLLHRLLD